MDRFMTQREIERADALNSGVRALAQSAMQQAIAAQEMADATKALVEVARLLERTLRDVRDKLQLIAGRM